MIRILKESGIAPGVTEIILRTGANRGGKLFPINKKLWTSSYVLYHCGLALLTLGTAAMWSKSEA